MEYRFTVYSTECRKRAVIRVMADSLERAIREPMLLTCCTGWVIARTYRVNGRIRSNRSLPVTPRDVRDYTTLRADEVCFKELRAGDGQPPA